MNRRRTSSSRSQSNAQSTTSKSTQAQDLAEKEHVLHARIDALESFIIETPRRQKETSEGGLGLMQLTDEYDPNLAATRDETVQEFRRRRERQKHFLQFLILLGVLTSMALWFLLRLF